MSYFKFFINFFVLLLLISCVEPDLEENFVPVPVNIRKTTTTISYNSTTSTVNTSSTVTAVTSTTIIEAVVTTTNPATTTIQVSTTSVAGTTTTTIAVGLVTNGSFEDRSNNWTELTTAGKFQISTTEYYEGSKSGYFSDITSSISGREVATNVFAIDGTKAINISAYFKTTNPVANTKVAYYLYYYTDPAGTTSASTASQYKTSACLTAQDTWEQVTYQKTASQVPDDATYCKITVRVMYVSGTGASTDKVYFDKIVVTNP